MAPLLDYSDFLGIPDISQGCHFVWGISKEFPAKLSKDADLQLWVSNDVFT